MKRQSPASLANRVLAALVFASSLALAACDNDVNLPTAPVFPRSPAIGERSLRIIGSLTAQNGTCSEATILYDGLELPGARFRCPDRRGCAALDLVAVTASGSGRHTISFQVLDQAADAVEYVARGEALVSREALGLGAVTINLAPTRATLRSGESVTFEILFED